jgi:serine protease
MNASARKPALLRAAALLLAALSALPAARAAEEFNPYAARLAPAETDRVIVKLRAPAQDRVQAQAASDRVAALAQRAGVPMRASRAIAADLHVIRVDGVQSVGGLENAIAKLRADSSVEYAEPDARMHRHAVPNDPLYSAQWYLQPVASTANGTTASAVNAQAAWDLTQGSRGVVVAVLDTGVRFDHPDLGRAESGGKLLPGYDFVSADTNGALTANDGDGWDADPSDPGDWISQTDKNTGGTLFSNCDLDDSSWHGTRVAGIVGAGTNNSAGVAGTGWTTWVLPVRVLGKCGGYTSDIIAGMRWSAGLTVSGAPANPYPAKVLNLSLGGDGSCTNAYQSAVDEIVARGVLVVVSAGNDGSTVDAPANCRGVAAIGALRHVGNKVGFSNLGPGVTISAPGGNCVNTGAGQPCLYSIDTTTNLGTTTPGSNDYTNQQNFNVGTSFSAPIVSAIAGLMYGVNGNLTPSQAIARLQASARPFPVVNETDPATGQPIPTCRVPTSASDTQTSQCNCTTSTCGAGMADAAAAVTAALRPIAAVQLPAPAAAGQQLALNASGSAAACNRTIASYAWSVIQGTAALTATSGAQTSLTVPAAGTTVVVRVTVTDDQGRTDTADVTVAAGSVSSTAPSSAGASACLTAITFGSTGGGTTPTTPTAPSGGGGGGGGALDGATLALGGLLALAAGAARRRRRANG